MHLLKSMSSLVSFPPNKEEMFIDVFNIKQIKKTKQKAKAVCGASPQPWGIVGGHTQ